MPKQSPAEVVIDVFGGISPLARLLKVYPSTVWEWPRKRKDGRGRSGQIPDKYHKPLLDLARQRRLRLTPKDLVLGR